jgi:predicted RNase H-like HicB family nuclease
MTQMTLTAVYMKVPQGYVAFVEELPGANTQGKTLEKARAILKEAAAMVLDANRERSKESLEGAEALTRRAVQSAERCSPGRPIHDLGQPGRG